MKIVIVGGAGLIGHSAALDLTERGHDVTIIDALMVNNYYALLNSGQERYMGFLRDRLSLLDKAGVPVLRLDARDYGMLTLALSPLEPDCIIHMAAVSHIDRSNKDPYSTFDHSLKTLENTLDVARNIKGNAHVIYFSSSTVYGNFQEPVLTEESICKPFGIYGAVKLSGEHIVNAYKDTYGMDCTIIRPCALYGPRCVSGRVGQKFIESALDGKPITIFGDGEIYEDFTYIKDFIQGLRLVVEKRERSSGETFNITSGKARTLNDLAEIVSLHTNAEIIHGEADPEKPHRGTLDIGKARDLLGYNPSYNLEDGIREYIGWYRGQDQSAQ